MASNKRSKEHRHECAACGRRFSCSKVHTVLDNGLFGLHPRCARSLAWRPENGLRIFLRPSRQPPPHVDPVTGNAAILARVVGRYSGPCALDVLAGAYQREQRNHGLDAFARLRKQQQQIEKDERDLVARDYGKELKARGKGKWHAAAIAAMNRGKKFGFVPFKEPGSVKTHFSRLHAREKLDTV